MNALQGDDTEENRKEKSVVEHIFPPREWTCKNSENITKTWRQTISKQLPNRSAMCQMVDQLKFYEHYFKCKRNGICEIRSAIYSLYFGNVVFLLPVQ